MRNVLDRWEKTQYTFCYAYGHSWFPYESDWKPEFAKDFMTLRCERCGTEKREAYGTFTGDLTLRYYIYPDGYRFQRGQEKPSKGTFRLMAVRLARKEQRVRREQMR